MGTENARDASGCVPTALSVTVNKLFTALQPPGAHSVNGFLAAAEVPAVAAAREPPTMH